ncbi:MAG: hypothetical protein KKA79_07860 [Nanoarchaeota archaeon]|nr:hypothetical protein [Nanoarchaeota archaeon]
MIPIRNKVILSFIAGGICVVLGGVPLLNLQFLNSIPGLFSSTITKVALLLGGLLLLYDGFQIKNPMTGMMKLTSLIAGMFMAAIGALPLLIDTGILNKYLPFIATLSISDVILQGLLIFFGFYLVYDALMLSRQGF